MTSAADTKTTPDLDDSDDDAIIAAARFTAEEPPPVARPSKWAGFLADVEARGLDPDEDDVHGILGPYHDADRAYSIASRIGRGKVPGSEPAGKFAATTRTKVLFDEDGNETKQSRVWVWLSDEFIANPDAFASNGESPHNG